MNRAGTHRGSPKTPAERPQGHQGLCPGHSIRFPWQRGCSPPGKGSSARWAPPALEFPAWLDPSKAQHLWKAPWGAKACSAWQSDPTNGCGSHKPHQSNCSSKAYPIFCHPRREQTQNPSQAPSAAGEGTPDMYQNSTQNTCNNNSNTSNMAPSRWSCLTAQFYPL